MKEIMIDSNPKNISKIRDAIENELENCKKVNINNIFLVTEEIFSNIINHGYKDCLGKVCVKIDCDTNNLKITFVDNGEEYNILKHDMPDVSLGLSERRCGGLGVFLIRKISDNITYKNINGLNYLTVYFNLNI